MAQLYRDQYAHYINTATVTGEKANPTYKREGTGIESLSIAFNADKESYKDITKRTTSTTFNNYQLSSSISDKRCFSDDPMYDYLYNLKKKAIAAETQLVEINTAKAVDGGYDATRYDILITINEWLGENAVISYDIDYENPTQGVATVSDGTITFTESVSL